MELHDALRELVAAHGTSIFDDASGFRGILDDVLEERQATTGDINLLVDAVRFDVLTPLVAMIDGGADPQRAVEEAGLRLARDRGGDDQTSSSWASAVLGYAVGKVPEAVLVRYRSLRGPSAQLPPGTAPPVGPPIQSPQQTAWPQQPQQPQQSPQPGYPTALPAHQSSPQSSPQSSYPSAPSYPGAGGYPPAPGFAGVPKKKKKGPALWIAAAVAGVVVVGGGVTGLVLAGGDGDAPKKPGESKSAGPDVEPAAINERYNSLASSITSGSSGCEAGEPGTGQSEVIDCKLSTGTLQLVTYDDAAALKTARTARLDYRSGTLISDNDTSALYQFDPDRGGSTDSAVIYWDTTSGTQSATITGEGTVKFDSVNTLYKGTSPRVAAPTSPLHSVLREFINVNMDVSTCKRQLTFYTDETEESECTATKDIVVYVGRYRTREGMRANRLYYKGKYDEAGSNGGSQGGGPTWRFGKGATEGAYFSYVDKDRETALVYWDFNKSDCYCYGIAWNFDGNLQALEDWWPSG